MNPALVWASTALLALLGVAGAVVPGLPGAPLILAAAVLHRWLLPGYVSGWTLGVLALLAALSVVVDVLCGMAGVRRFGGGRWGALGAAVGAAIGLFFGPFGLLAGAVLGAAACEMAFDRRAFDEALKAGAGAALGLLVGTAARLGISVFMAAWLAADLAWN
jgi:uncharacterized protein YqgC (DUF456 family)